MRACPLFDLPKAVPDAAMPVSTSEWKSELDMVLGRVRDLVLFFGAREASHGFKFEFQHSKCEADPPVSFPRGIAWPFLLSPRP